MIHLAVFNKFLEVGADVAKKRGNGIEYNFRRKQ